MGTSKRYAHAVDAQMSERILESAAASGRLQTLGGRNCNLMFTRAQPTRDPSR